VKETLRSKQVWCDGVVYMPCIPAINFKVSVSADKNSETSAEDFATPLIKVSETAAQENGLTITGVASGKRSAIIVNRDGTYTRLKGCGNLDQGFPLEPLGYPPDMVEVRGCAFESTVYREIAFQQRVNTLMEQHDLTGGNKPLGVWKYPENLGSDLFNECPS